MWRMFLVAGLSACVSEVADPAPVYTTHSEPVTIDCMAPADPELPEQVAGPSTFAAEDPALQASLERVLSRLRHSAGLDLRADEHGARVAYSDLPDGVGGWASNRGAEIDVSVDAFALDTIVLHEVMHLIGANHLGPYEGVMSRCVGAGSIGLTAADLERLCAAAPCTAFAPEM